MALLARLFEAGEKKRGFYTSRAARSPAACAICSNSELSHLQ
jgi:hypothetical protein